MSQIPSLIGEKLRSYRLDSVLGSGAMGVVYLATDEKRGHPAAVKVVHNELAQGPNVQSRFIREAEILRHFSHPGIVRFLGGGKFRGTLYIAMEFIQGSTLEKILEERGAIPWREAATLAVQICNALHYAHEHGVIHRDLKPSNLMITEDGKVKLTDFGIAKDLDKTALTAPGRTLGTAAYMAPEQIRGTPPVSHKTDLYSLGVVLYQMLTGRPPFEGSTAVVLMHCHMNEEPPRPSDKVHEIPKALDNLVVSLMAKVPSDRPWDAAAVEHILTELLDKAERGESIAMVWPSSGSSAAKPPRGGVPSGGIQGDSFGTERPKRKARKASLFSTLASSAFSTRSRNAPSDLESRWPSRGLLEIAGLLLALLAVGGLIVYLVWPASQETLYRKAEALMASTRRADWLTAREEYLEPLERRFPDNPYREQIRAWRDKILLEDAERRWKILTAGVKPFSEPSNDAERQVVITTTLATEASGRRDDLVAVQQWRELAKLLKPDDPEERLWYLLASRRVEQLEAAIRNRRKYIEKQLQIADEAFRTGHPNQAISIRSKLVEQYTGYTDLADLFPATPVPVQPAPATPAPVQPAPTTKSSDAVPPSEPNSTTPAEAPATPKF